MKCTMNATSVVFLYMQYAVVTLADLGYSSYPVWFTCYQTLLSYLAFQSFDSEHN